MAGAQAEWQVAACHLREYSQSMNSNTVAALTIYMVVGKGNQLVTRVSPELRTIRENGDMGSIKECGGNLWKVNDWKQF